MKSSGNRSYGGEMIYKSQHSNAESFARFFPRQSKGVGITFWAVPSRSKPFDSEKKNNRTPDGGSSISEND